MQILGLHIADWVVVFVYLGGITLVGLRASRSMKSEGDFFMAGRRFGKLFAILHMFGTGTHTDHPVSVSGKSYQVGLAGIWYQWLWLFCTPFYWLIAPFFRRMRCLTIADAFERRYGKGIAGLYAFVGIFVLATNIGIMLFLSARTIHAITGIREFVLILIMSILFMLYSTAGGLVAAVLTDFVQGLFIIVLSFLILPFALYHKNVGGFSGLHQKLGEGMFSLTAPQNITWFWIAIAPLLGGLIYGVERILRARMQRRQGPPMLQPFYDMFKLMDKRTLVIHATHALLGVIHFLILWVTVGAIFYVQPLVSYLYYMISASGY